MGSEVIGCPHIRAKKAISPFPYNFAILRPMVTSLVASHFLMVIICSSDAGQRET